MKSTNKFKTEHGITLVALIITIIVLVILAAVSINAVFNANFIGLATNGTINYAEAQANEEKEMENLDSFLQNTITKLDENDFSGSGGDSNNPPSSIIIPTTENDIGKYVDYKPTSGNYVASKTRTGVSALSSSVAGYNLDQEFVTDATLKWRIFKVESNNLYLISDIPTTSAAGGFSGNTGKLQLYSFEGYNNGVKLLNDMCNACYSNSSYSEISVRSLNLADIENITTYDYTSFTNGYGYKYGAKKSYSSGSAPNIWYTHDINDQIGLRNIQDRWFSAYASGYGVNISNIMQTRWQKYYSEENSSSEWINPKYYELLMSPTNDNNFYPTYYLSSRFIDLLGDRCSFGSQCVYNGSVNAGSLYISQYHEPNIENFNIRPLVSIPLSSCNITARWK